MFLNYAVYWVVMITQHPAQCAEVEYVVKWGLVNWSSTFLETNGGAFILYYICKCNQRTLTWNTPKNKHNLGKRWLSIWLQTMWLYFHWTCVFYSQVLLHTDGSSGLTIWPVLVRCLHGKEKLAQTGTDSMAPSHWYSKPHCLVTWLWLTSQNHVNWSFN